VDSGIQASEKIFPPVLLYHKVTSVPELGITRTTSAGFRRQMQFLLEKGYKLHSLSGLADISEEASDEPNSSIKHIGLTFDDAYSSVYKNAFDVLSEFGFSATVFVPVNYIGRRNDWDPGRFMMKFDHMGKGELKEWISAGNEVGCHSASHQHLSLVSKMDRYSEIEGAGRRLEDLTGSKVNWFAPPFGWYDRHVLDTVQEAGYYGTAILRKRKTTVCPPELTLLERRTVYLADSFSMLQAKIDSGSSLYNIEQIRLGLIQAGSWGTVAVQALKQQKEKLYKSG